MACSGFIYYFSFVMNDLDLLRIEKELKKRHRYPYTWFRKQNDQWDQFISFIYKTPKWEDH